jgi:hypothetical protein
MASKKDIRKALAAQEADAATTNVAGATTVVDPNTGEVRSEGGVGSEFIPGATAAGTDVLGQAGQRIAQGAQPQDANFDATQLFTGGLTQTQTGNKFAGIGSGIADAFSGFDQTAFAKDAFDKLENIAGPGESNAANTLANRLFSSGRLGGDDTKSGRAFGELATAQSGARDERALRSLEFAGTEADRLAGLAQSFGESGASITGQGTQNVANIFGTLRGEDQFQQDFTGGQINQAGQLQEQAIQGTTSQQNAINAAFAGADLAQQRRDSKSKALLSKTPKAGGSVLGGIAKGVLGGAATAFGGPLGAAAAGAIL